MSQICWKSFKIKKPVQKLALGHLFILFKLRISFCSVVFSKLYYLLSLEWGRLALDESVEVDSTVIAPGIIITVRECFLFREQIRIWILWVVLEKEDVFFLLSILKGKNIRYDSISVCDTNTIHLTDITSLCFVNQKNFFTECF